MFPRTSMTEKSVCVDSEEAGPRSWVVGLRREDEVLVEEGVAEDDLGGED